jgi:chromosomal replication initiation ATPase DnaA
MGMSARRRDDEAAARLAASVASYGLGVSSEAILGEERGTVEVAFARQVAMYLCHAGFQLSLTRVAVAFGRDRSTVSYACHMIEDRRDEPQFDLWMSGLEAMLEDPPLPGVRGMKPGARR